MKAYIVITTGIGEATDNKVYLNKATAEKVAKEMAYHLYMSGSNNTAYVEERELIEK